MSVYNGERYLAESIESILSQTFRDFEFIIIDDGSTDRTSEILAQYQGHDARVKVYVQAQSGLVDGLNRGCALASGEYIARMDADDIAFPQRLEREVDFLENNPQVALVGAAVVVTDANGLPIDALCFPSDSHEIDALLMRSNCINHSTILMRTNAFRALHGYRKKFRHAEDYDLWLRMAEQYALANLPEPLLYYRVHGSQVSVQHLSQLVVSMLGAQVAAQARRRGENDPLANVTEINTAVLSESGVTQGQIQTAFVTAFLNMLNLLLKGNPDTGFQLVAETPEIFQAQQLPTSMRKSAADQVLKIAYHHYSHKRFVIAKALVRLSLTLDPRGLSRANAIRLIAKLLLGERGTRLVSNLKTRSTGIP